MFRASYVHVNVPTKKCKQQNTTVYNIITAQSHQNYKLLFLIMTNVPFDLTPTHTHVRLEKPRGQSLTMSVYPQDIPAGAQ